MVFLWEYLLVWQAEYLKVQYNKNFFASFLVRILLYRSICFGNTLGTTEVPSTCALFVDFSTTEVPIMIHGHILRVEITLCIYKSHSCVLKSHFAFRSYTCTCVHHSMRVNIIHKSDFYTYSGVLTRMSVMITLIRVNITICV
jgi:hypothetical protein